MCATQGTHQGLGHTSCSLDTHRSRYHIVNPVLYMPRVQGTLPRPWRTWCFHNSIRRRACVLHVCIPLLLEEPPKALDTCASSAEELTSVRASYEAEAITRTLSPLFWASLRAFGEVKRGVTVTHAQTTLFNWRNNQRTNILARARPKRMGKGLVSFSVR